MITKLKTFGIIGLTLLVTYGVLHVFDYYMLGRSHHTKLIESNSRCAAEIEDVVRINSDNHEELKNVQESLKTCQSADSSAVVNSVFGEQTTTFVQYCEACYTADGSCTTNQVTDYIDTQPYYDSGDVGDAKDGDIGEQDELFDFEKASEEFLRDGN